MLTLGAKQVPPISVTLEQGGPYRGRETKGESDVPMSVQTMGRKGDGMGERVLIKQSGRKGGD